MIRRGAPRQISADERAELIRRARQLELAARWPGKRLPTMTPIQALVLAEIRRAGQAGVPLERLERLLADYRELRRLDPPQDPQLVVRVTVHQVNRALVAANKPRICARTWSKHSSQ